MKNNGILEEVFDPMDAPLFQKHWNSGGGVLIPMSARMFLVFKTMEL